MSNSSSHTHVDNYAVSDSDSDTDSSQSLLAHGTDYQQQSIYHGTDITPRPEPAVDRERRKSFIQEDEDPLQIDLPVKKKKEYVGWRDLPNKTQLAILTVARLSEPLVQTSLRVSLPLYWIGTNLMFPSSHICSISSNRLTKICLTLLLLLKLVSCRGLLRLHSFVLPCSGAESQMQVVGKGCF
jgi:CRISPR/Cas system-associated endoribonuclease Cas2